MLFEMFYGTFTNRKKDCIQLHEDFINLGNERKTLYISAIEDKHYFFPESSMTLSYLNEYTHEE